MEIMRRWYSNNNIRWFCSSSEAVNMSEKIQSFKYANTWEVSTMGLFMNTSSVQTSVSTFASALLAKGAVYWGERKNDEEFKQHYTSNSTCFSKLLRWDGKTCRQLLTSLWWPCGICWTGEIRDKQANKRHCYSETKILHRPINTFGKISF